MNMQRCTQSPNFSSNRNKRREKMLRKMEKMRAAKERKRHANPVEREPERVRYYPLQLGIRNKLTGETAWVDFRSVRNAAKRLSVIQKHYLHQ